MQRESSEPKDTQVETRSYESIVEDLRNYQVELEVQNEELRKTHQDLAKVKRKYQNLWENAPIGFILHTKAGDIETANNRAIELLELKQKPTYSLWTCLPLTQASIFHRNLRAFLRSGNSMPIEIQTNGSRGENAKWLLAETVLVENGLLQTALIDISDRKSAEQKSEAMMGQLRHAQKMEILNQMSSGIAHDFNNILQIVMINAELVLGLLKDRPDLNNLVNDIRISANRGSDLTRRLLAFGRNNPLMTRVEDLNDVCAECMTIVQRTFSEEIRLDFQKHSQPVHVAVDSSQIEQVLLNLCLNSRDAIGESDNQLGARLGETTSDTSQIKAAINIQVGVENLNETYEEFGLSIPPGSYATLSLQDNGQGMVGRDLYKIFEPFYTSKPVGQGTGLGLAIVYGVIQQHQGAIKVETSNEGTCFTIYLPLIDRSATVVSGMPDELEKVSYFECTRILIVEDEPAIRKAVANALEDDGLEVLVAENGREAIELINNASSDIDALVTDVVMPEVGGKDVCKAFRDRFPDAEIVLISGHGDSVLNSKFLMNYGATFLPKPFTVNDLIQCLSRTTYRGE